jgi:drug/metabolite transporter (DMT)-like permease
MRAAVLRALLSALLFGAATPASKLLLVDLTALQLAGLLYLGAALGMAPLVLRERSRAERRGADPASRRRLAWAVLCGGVLGPVLLLVALRLASAASVSLMLQMELFATALLGALFFRDALSGRAWLGVGCAVAAGALVAAEGGWPGAAAAALATAACVCWALDNQLTSLLTGISPARATCVKGAAAGVLNLGLGLALAPLGASAAGVAAALAVGALSYGASIALWIRAAQELGATRAQAIFASGPFLGAGLSVLVLRDPVGALHLAAAGLFVLALWCLLAGRHEHEHLHEALEHDHSHRHDDGHHLHAHRGLPAWTRHSHPHAHAALVHAHPHTPDLHHRHAHGKRADP